MKDHKCPENVHAKIEIIYGPSIDEPGEDWTYWRLRVVNVANKQAVTDGEAEFVGQVLHTTLFSIFFCPFCGIKLDDNTS